MVKIEESGKIKQVIKEILAWIVTIVLAVVVARLINSYVIIYKVILNNKIEIKFKLINKIKLIKYKK